MRLVRLTVVLLFALVCAAQTTWPPADATIMTAGGPARTSYSPIRMGLTQRPQFSFALQQFPYPVGYGNVMYNAESYSIQLINSASGAVISELVTQEMFNQSFGSISYLTLTPYGFAACYSGLVLGVTTNETVELSKFNKNSYCSNEIVPSYDGSMVYFFSIYSSTLYAVDSQNASIQLWSNTYTSFTSISTSNMAQDSEGFLYFGPIVVGDFTYRTYYYVKVNGSTGEVVCNSTLEDDLAQNSLDLMVDVGSRQLYMSNGSSFFAYSLDYELLWTVNNENYNDSLNTNVNTFNLMALNAESSATIIYWCSQEYLYALNPVNGAVLWSIIPNPATSAILTNVYATADNVVFLGDGMGNVHAVDENATRLWTVNVNNGNTASIRVVPVGNAAIVQSGSWFGGLVQSAIRGLSAPVLALGMTSALTVYPSGMPQIQSLHDNTFVSVSCQVVTATGALALNYTGNPMGNVIPMTISCSTGSTTSALTPAAYGITLTYVYNDGYVYTTPVYPQKFVVLASVSTPGANMGNNTITLSGSGFASCQLTGVLCQGVFDQIPGKVFPMTVVSDTVATIIAPPSPSHNRQGYISGLAIQVRNGSSVTLTFSQQYEWSTRPWFVFTPTIWALIIGLPVACLAGCGGWMFYRWRSRRLQEERESLLPANKVPISAGK